MLKTYWIHEGRTHQQKTSGKRYSVTTVSLLHSKMSTRAGVSGLFYLHYFTYDLVEPNGSVEVVLYVIFVSGGSAG